MITYIRNNIEGYYAEFPLEIDNVYWQGKIGTTYEDFTNGKWVKLSEQQVQFHINNPDTSVREVIAMLLDKRTLEKAKEEKLKAIEDYDSSDAVNEFYVFKNELSPEQWEELLPGEKEQYRNIHTISSWLTPAERSNYRNSIDSADTVGMESVEFYVGDIPFTLTIQNATLMLAQIQLYADACANVTKRHILAMEALDTIEAVDGYDNTVGYPEKLTFYI